MSHSHAPSGQPLPGWGQKLRAWPAKTSRTAVALATLAGLTLAGGAHPNQNSHKGSQANDITLQGEI